MKLQHYLGGLEGLPEPLNLEKKVFVEDWEKRIFGIHVAMMGLSNHLGSALPGYPIAEVPTTFRDEWTWASLRTGAEGMNPFDYFKFRYYEKWLGGISQFFVDNGYVSEEEIADLLGVTDPPVAGPGSPAIDEQVIDYLRRGDSPRRDVAHPKFEVGDQVLITNAPAGAHTRLPGYLRAKTGTVQRIFEGDYGYFVHTGDGIGDPMPIYIVEFTPEELWGPRAEPGANALYAELFEAYLEPIEEDR
ncbi:nitrile hydratase subunit beta [Mycolicibacterium gilvum]|uniref:nitrile hydratase n=1 Tax=Mycolicibacterium gilvum (strain DSM 45189 / LMG 24558 / Spyr1) TaxID=278137 RepID=E6TNM9_MYCSR|nr:nitrile hydratase subunit beta [Mycolicibacterium gilvum]ADU01706.1 Nitrile hydratase beta subunit [Mycolicibacterium gilvum Spyr1]